LGIKKNRKVNTTNPADRCGKTREENRCYGTRGTLLVHALYNFGMHIDLGLYIQI
jgi:hypothetical protein